MFFFQVIVRFSKGTLPCIRSYLSEQIFLVNIESKLSDFEKISCILHQHKEEDEIEKELNKDFENICDWFVDNELRIHFGKGKSKSIKIFGMLNKGKNKSDIHLFY